MAEIGVIGSGSWGTALALVLNKNGHHVTIWSYLKEEADEIREKRENPSKLPGVHIPEEIEITTDLQGSVEGKDVVVLAVPSMATRATAKKMCPYVKEEQILVNVAKGIEEGTLKTLSEQIEEEIPQANVAVLSGPSHAEEVSRELPTTVVVGAETEETAIYLQKIFMNDVFRVYTSPDIKGIELGGSLKNVIALAAGVADGLGYGDNTKAALITRGIAEITRLGIKMGGKLESFTGLTGIGDLIVTCASKHSRNRKAGVLIGEGMTMEEAMAEVKMVVEGVYSAKAARELAEKYEVSMPIVEKVNQVLFDSLHHGHPGPAGRQVDLLPHPFQLIGSQIFLGKGGIHALGDVHHGVEVRIGLIQLHGGELGIVLGVHALVAEDAADLVHPVHAADNEPL